MNVEFVGEDVGAVPAVRTLLDSCSGDRSLSDFLGSLRGELLENGYMIGQIHVDSRQFDRELEKDIGEDPVARFEGVQVSVAPAGSYIGETFRECMGASERLDQLKNEITDSVRTGQVSKVSERLAEFTDGLAVITSAYQDGLQILARIGLANIEEVEVGQKQLSSLVDVLNEVLEGINLQDFVLVSDALEYELPEYLEGLTREFQLWCSRLLDRPSDAEQVASRLGVLNENES